MKQGLASRLEALRGIFPYRSGRGGRRVGTTDLLLCRRLGEEVEKVRDRLADLVDARPYGDHFTDKAVLTLHVLDFLREEIQNGALPGEFDAPWSPEIEARLVDFDLVLLEKVAGLNTPLDNLDWARSSWEAEVALSLLDEGVAEVDELYRRLRTALYSEGERHD